jgi:hypothetical protein
LKLSIGRAKNKAPSRNSHRDQVAEPTAQTRGEEFAQKATKVTKVGREFNAKAQRGKGATKELKIRISRIDTNF